MHSWFIECGCESIKGSQSGVRVAAFANLHRPTKLQRLTALGWALSFLRARRHAGLQPIVRVSRRAVRDMGWWGGAGWQTLPRGRHSGIP